MRVVIAGGGNVGTYIASELRKGDHEVLIVEVDGARVADMQTKGEPEGVIWLQADGCEVSELVRAEPEKADVMVAVTGDDEDNLVICQVAKDKYGVERVIARVNNPRNRQHFELLGVKPYVSATDLIMRLIEREVPRYGLVHLLDLADAKIEIIDLLIGEEASVVGKRIDQLEMPKGSLLISVVRDGSGFVPTADTVLEAGDEVLAVLDPSVEGELTAYLGLDGSEGGSVNRSPD